MADSFNPYRDWLGLADGQRPATYYGLFGLRPLESDPERIHNAIARLAAKVRAIHPGNRVRQWQYIMDEISAGKTCLTDPAAKAAYDAQLRGAPATHKPPPQVSTAPPSDGLPPPVAPPIVRASKPKATRRRRRRTSSMLLLGVVLLVMMAATLLGKVLYDEHRKSVDLAQSQAQAAKKAAERPASKAEADSGSLKLGGLESRPLPSEPALQQKSLADVVAALAKRDLSAAKAAAANAALAASSPEERKTAEKYQKLCDDVGQFWRVIWERVNKFQPKEEVTLGKTRIVVVEAGEGRFSFKVGSKIRVCTAETVPSWLAIALADGNLVGDGLTKELYGAFLAVDPEGDRARAKVLWSEAAGSGVKIEESLPAIDSLPPTAGP